MPVHECVCVQWIPNAFVTSTSSARSSVRNPFDDYADSTISLDSCRAAFADRQLFNPRELYS
jgi:hypothetical protein